MQIQAITPKRNAFLSMVYLGLVKQGYFETKGKTVKFKSPLTAEAFRAQYGPFIKRMFRQLWGQNLDAITAKRVTDAMRGIDTDLLDQAQRNIEVFGNTVYAPGMSTVIGKGGQVITDAINSMADASMFFDVGHPSVTNWLRDHTAEQIVGELWKTQRAAIKGIIGRSLKEKLSFQQTKSLLKSGMVLTKTQLGWVDKRYTNAFDESLKRYVADGLPNPVQRARNNADRIADRWRRRYLDYRQETIVRTEAGRVRNLAEQAGLIQAEENGFIKNTLRTWRRTSTENNHESSIINDGETRRLRETFPSGHEFPSEINEQCILETTFELIKKPGRPGKPIGRIPGISKPKPKVKPKPAKFVEAKTIKEAERWAMDNGLAETVNWAGVPNTKEALSVINQTQKQIFEYFQKHSKLQKFKMKFLGTWQNRNNQFSKIVGGKIQQNWQIGEGCIAQAMVTEERIRGLAFNRDIFDDIGKTLELFKKYEKRNFFAKGCNTFKALVDHEMGHYVDGMFKISDGEDFLNIYNKYKKDYGKVVFNLSQYATTSKYEFIAESWAEYLNNPNPREISAGIGNIIESIIGAK